MRDRRKRGRRTYPVSLAVEQRRGLVEHLLEGLLLGDALGEGRSVGVDLGLTSEVSGVVRSLGGKGGTYHLFVLSPESLTHTLSTLCSRAGRADRSSYASN